jgi:hypothetical protein
MGVPEVYSSMHGKARRAGQRPEQRVVCRLYHRMVRRDDSLLFPTSNFTIRER